ncbi:MAG TPA: hypothetical protein VHA52_10640 [Candidatus Babeliaceae bacterium]|nr:hypothetical protein [Candidatus Babeliaceae bacterium]
MTKRIPKEQEKKSIIIEIDAVIANSLGIKQASDLRMFVIDDMLIIKPKASPDRDQKFKLKERNERLMEQYDSILKKLAKT